VVEFLKYGWPINYSASQSPHSTMCNHPSALAFPDHVRHYIQTKLSFGAIAGPFSTNPLHKPLVCSPLQTVPKRGSSKRRVVLDLSFPPTFSVNSGIPLYTYLDSPFKLQLPGIKRLCELILAKGRGCCVYKKDLQRAYCQFPIDPKDYYLLGFTFDNHIHFDTRCPFGLQTSAMICQWTTKPIIYILMQAGFSADVYLDDFTVQNVLRWLTMRLLLCDPFSFTTGLWDSLLGYPHQYQGFYITCSRVELGNLRLSTTVEWLQLDEQERSGSCR